ncbi:ABC transporter ATP-binding protein, partial [Mesorhizobium sp. M7A.F.Ca.CA.004.04.1.1]|uniref:ABC transporter ATP-binding protein n=1 Tax=Mesorhizobium sp. M7A.F.Ca.CA.004.04.1.1 TaxID=2496733 RepID=UPI001FE080C7
PWRLSLIMGSFLLSTLADVLTPLYSGRLVDAVASSAGADAIAWNAAMTAFSMLMALALAGAVLRNLAFMGIVELTLKMMADIAADAFHRVQRFSTDWHANSFAGSTVRKVTRGMWALDLLNDTILIALLPSIVMLVGSTLLLGWFWPLMGAVVAAGSVLFITVTALLSLGYVAPAARLANTWDTRLGAKWRARTRRTWVRGTINGTTQGVLLLVMRAAVIGLALMLWSWGQASAGDVAFVLTSLFVLQGYLRDIGTHIRNLQRSINDMEELVDFQSEPLGIEDRPGAKPIRITEGRISFDNVTFHYGHHRSALYRDFSVDIAPGERVGLVGHSGSGKTTFVKLIQRLYDVNAGKILVDGQDISQVAQASLRGQIAIVQQEPILFHRSLAENIAYARPSATQEEIEHAAKLASAHDFITSLPKGYGTLVGERGVKLSGGERQRVAIARAFLADARILILDEATSSLDSESEVLIQQAMERLMVGRTTLVIAHRLSTVRALDRLLVFDRGNIVEEGSHNELIRLKGGIYRRLFERQALELTKGLVS